MKYYLLLILCLSIAVNRLSAQNITKETGHVNGQSLVYYAMQPQGKVNGVLILLAAKGEKPRSIFDQTNSLNV
jgi:hypothetical protein